MAGPSPSPSSRRLLDLLGQQQEPFSLDVYLLERGCSPALLDAAVGGGACSTTCWPWRRGTRSAAAGRTAVPRPAARSCASGVLRLLFCRVLRGKVVTPAATTAKKKLPAITLCRVEKQRTTPGAGGIENSVPLPRCAADEACSTEGGKAEKVVEDEDEDSSKRLSPVSMLEEHLPPAHEQKATLLIFSELQLVQAAYAPTLLDILTTDAKTCSRSSSNRSQKPRTKTSPAARKKKKKKNHHGRWEEEEDVFEEALAAATGLVASEMAGAKRAWPERRDVGVDVAAAVLDALVEETATELTIATDRGLAVGTARR